MSRFIEQKPEEEKKDYRWTIGYCGNVRLDAEHLEIAAYHLKDIGLNGNDSVVRINGKPIGKSKVKPGVISEADRKAAYNQYKRITIDYPQYLNEQEELKAKRRQWVAEHPEWRKAHPLKTRTAERTEKQEEEAEL